jgi:hypothetical protein
LFFVSDFSVHFEHPVVILEHMTCHGPSEGILGVRIDIHLDDAIVDGLMNFFRK